MNRVKQNKVKSVAQKAALAEVTRKKAKWEVDKAPPGKLNRKDWPPVLRTLTDPLFAQGAATSIVLSAAIGEGDNATVYDATTPDHKPLMHDSPFGRVRVVIKEFREVNEDGLWVVLDGSKNILHKCDTERDALTWTRVNLQKIPKQHVVEFARIDTSSPGKIGTGEFVNETAVHVLATEAVKAGLTPHVAVCTGAVLEHGNGFLFVERIHDTFDEFTCSRRDCGWTPGMVASWYFQLLHTLYTLQSACHFKHHDLHPSNVFVQDVQKTDAVFGGIALKDATHYCYHMADGTTYTVPATRYIVKLADFGFASGSTLDKKTRFFRQDIDQFNDKLDSWGAWSESLTGEHGYDAHVFFGELPMSPSSFLGRMPEVKRLSRKLQEALVTWTAGDKPISYKDAEASMTRKHRPAVGKVSDALPENMIQHVFGTSPEGWYDFRAPPPADAKVIHVPTQPPSTTTQ